jgi:uncharacterized protein
MGDNGWQNMPAQLSVEAAKSIAENLNTLYQIQQRPFSVILHGGEPLLLGRNKLKSILEILHRFLPSDCEIGIQSNGILITNEILDFCYETKTTISVSLDGPREINDKFRVAHDGSGTFNKIIKGIEILKNHRESAFLYSGILAVVNPNSDPFEVYNFLKTLRPPSINFLYRDGNYVNLPFGKSSVNSTEYGEWFSKLLEIYLNDPKPLRIKFLDDLIKLILAGEGSNKELGLTEHGVLVIDSDGSIAKNDTLKSSFDGADRFNQDWSVFTHKLDDILKTKEFLEYHLSQHPTSQICRECPDLYICGGGLALHRWHPDNSYDNPSVYCADQKLIIKKVRTKLEEFQSLI